MDVQPAYALIVERHNMVYVPASWTIAQTKSASVRVNLSNPRPVCPLWTRHDEQRKPVRAVDCQASLSELAPFFRASYVLNTTAQLTFKHRSAAALKISRRIKPQLAFKHFRMQQ